MSAWRSIDELLEADEDRRLVHCSRCPITFDTERDREEHEVTHNPCPTPGCTEYQGHPGWCTPAKAALLPHCPHGHTFTVENTLWTRDRHGSPVRRCRECGREAHIRQRGRP